MLWQDNNPHLALFTQVYVNGHLEIGGFYNSRALRNNCTGADEALLGYNNDDDDCYYYYYYYYY